jgi:heme oxygenase
MAEPWMLERLKRETSQHHLAADHDRLSIIGTRSDVGRYAAFLSRIYGFEAPVESALAMTKGVDELVDLRARSHIRLLRADLAALGVVDPSTLFRASVVGFRDLTDALGWMYVVERNTLLHTVLERHLRSRFPDMLRTAGSYLAAHSGDRMHELGIAITRAARSISAAERVVVGAQTAFAAQHAWYEVVAPSRQQVACAP